MFIVTQVQYNSYCLACSCGQGLITVSDNGTLITQFMCGTLDSISVQLTDRRGAAINNERVTRVLVPNRIGALSGHSVISYGEDDDQFKFVIVPFRRRVTRSVLISFRLVVLMVLPL